MWHRLLQVAQLQTRLIEFPVVAISKEHSRIVKSHGRIEFMSGKEARDAARTMVYLGYMPGTIVSCRVVWNTIVEKLVRVAEG